MPRHSSAEQTHSHHKNSNLWLGFAFGAISAATLTFFLGTKKGRQMLKKILDISENLEENALVIAEQIEEEIMEKADKIADLKQGKPVLGSILEKIKNFKN